MPLDVQGMLNEQIRKSADASILLNIRYHSIRQFSQPIGVDR